MIMERFYNLKSDYELANTSKSILVNFLKVSYTVFLNSYTQSAIKISINIQPLNGETVKDPHPN